MIIPTLPPSWSPDAAAPVACEFRQVRPGLVVCTWCGQEISTDVPPERVHAACPVGPNGEALAARVRQLVAAHCAEYAAEIAEHAQQQAARCLECERFAVGIHCGRDGQACDRRERWLARVTGGECDRASPTHRALAPA